MAVTEPTTAAPGITRPLPGSTPSPEDATGPTTVAPGITSPLPGPTPSPEQATGPSPLAAPTGAIPRVFDSPPASPPARAGGPLSPGQVLANADAYLGKEITVEGVVKAEGTLPEVRFYLEGQGGARLEVTPWLPWEVVMPPDGGEAPASMLSIVDRRARVTGTLAKGGDGLILKVVSADILQ